MELLEWLVPDMMEDLPEVGVTELRSDAAVGHASIGTPMLMDIISRFTLQTTPTVPDHAGTGT